MYNGRYCLNSLWSTFRLIWTYIIFNFSWPLRFDCKFVFILLNEVIQTLLGNYKASGLKYLAIIFWLGSYSTRIPVLYSVYNALDVDVDLCSKILIRHP